MTDAATADGPARLSPLMAMWRYKWISAALVLVGLLLGVAYASREPVKYSAAARVRLGATGDLTPGTTAGIEPALEQAAADYARSVTTENYKVVAPKTLGDVDGVNAITATPIPSSAVIEIDVSAADAATAVKVAAWAQQYFISTTNAQNAQSSPATIRARIVTESNAVAAAARQVSTAQTEIGRLQALANPPATQLAAEQTLLQQAQAAQGVAQANLSADTSLLTNVLQNTTPVTSVIKVTDAVGTGDNKKSLVERWGLIGLALGAVLALAASLLLDRRRVRGEAAALEADLPLAEVTDLRADAPAARATEPRRAAPSSPVSAPAVAAETEIAAERPSETRRAAARADDATTTGASGSSRRSLRRGKHGQPAGPKHATRSTAEEPAPASTSSSTPEPAPQPLTDDPYLAQALRTSLDQQQRDATARREAEQEAHRRAVRDALQRMSREREAQQADDGYFAAGTRSTPDHDTAADQAESRTDAARGPVPAVEPPAAQPTQAPYADPTALDDDGPIAEVRPLFGDRRPARDERPPIRVYPTSADPDEWDAGR